jgi:hypothetical protein
MNQNLWKYQSKQNSSAPTRKYEETLNRLAKFLEQTKVRTS